MTRYTTNSDAQPAIPQGTNKPIFWDALNAQERNWITKATEVRIGKAFSEKQRQKILYGMFFQLSLRIRNQIYATDWHAELRKMQELSRE
jgi:hypothetical protein